MASPAAAADLIVYSTPTCPDCHALKAWLNERGIPLIERDLTDPQIVEEAKPAPGCASPP